ncbi:hypothetical protein cyc_02576 [Cyclospora cayetanensis]|uniref:Vacuolar protein sorting-associated protein 13 VPS13 adaptor binding domain-containing protein n=1 Tax=Cyclospora cayetanensis TaxID=88456 RepID=A0A1D3CYU5_9EIME|nr:hypothetical protein cyc_02576 [Cyclospora cayetanensis]
MLESFLLPRINLALSNIFEDLEAHQVDASILNGFLILRNLKLKRDALAALSLPIDVTYGHVGKLEIKLKLWRLLSEPITVCAEDILIIITSQPPSDWNVEREERVRDQHRNLILLTDECLTYAREESGLPCVLQRAAYAIIQRIRLSLTRLELRLEDTETDSKRHFALGMRVSRLFSLRCASAWEEGPALESETTPTHSRTADSRASLGHDSQGWFGWIVDFHGRKEKSAITSTEGIAQSFYLKTILEDASVYLDPLNDDHHRRSWLPYPAAFREEILDNLSQLLVTEKPCLSTDESRLPIPLAFPEQGAGTGCATPVPLGTLREVFEGRRKQKEQTSDTLDDRYASALQPSHQRKSVTRWRGCGRLRLGQAEATRPTEEPADVRCSSTHRATARPSGAANVHVAYPEESSKTVTGLLRFSDLYCPTELWKVASLQSTNHMYILKPGEVQLRARCLQRPMASSCDSARIFARPFPTTMATGPAADNILLGMNGENEAVVHASASPMDESPPALSVNIVAHGAVLQFTVFQMSSIFRWLHYAVVLYQELVSGVYAMCLEASPSQEELMRYRLAWRRHLLTNALVATGGGRKSELQKQDIQKKEFLNNTLVSSFDFGPAKTADEDFIRLFEAKYWPTVIIPARQQVLQDLQRQIRLGHCKEVYLSYQQRNTLEMSIGLSEAAPLTPQSKRGEEGIEEVHEYTDVSDIQVDPGILHEVEEMAYALGAKITVPAEADPNFVKCIEQMQFQRFSKSFEFALQLDHLQLTLGPDYEAPAFICMAVGKMHAQVAAYYDLRTSAVAAFNSIQIRDNLMPNLPHCFSVSSQACAKALNSSEKVSDHAAFSKDRENIQSSDTFISSHDDEHTRDTFLSGTPPLCTFHPTEQPCIPKWNNTCTWPAGCCPFKTPTELFTKPKSKKQESRNDLGGGWIRFEKVFVPLEGVPDLVLYMQTHGSLFCTVTPDAVLKLAQVLQGSIQLAERSTILEATSERVQEALRHNELFMARSHLYAADHQTVDICIDIPISHQLLLPFSKKEPECPGILLRSGVISVDTYTRRPDIQNSKLPRDAPIKRYDRYTVTITGASVERVPNCLDFLRRFQGTENSDACSYCKGDSTRRHTIRSAATTIHGGPSDPFAFSKEFRWCTKPQGGVTDGVRAREPVNIHVGSESEENTMGASQDAVISNDPSHFCVGDTSQAFLIWPTSIEGCVDLCHAFNYPDLPAFCVTLQDQQYSGVYITLSDEDIIALAGYFAELQTLVQALSTLWNPHSEAEDVIFTNPVSSDSPVQMPAQGVKRSVDVATERLDIHNKEKKIGKLVIKEIFLLGSLQGCSDWRHTYGTSVPREDAHGRRATLNRSISPTQYCAEPRLTTLYSVDEPCSYTDPEATVWRNNSLRTQHWEAEKEKAHISSSLNPNSASNDRARNRADRAGHSYSGKNSRRPEASCHSLSGFDIRLGLSVCEIWLVRESHKGVRSIQRAHGAHVHLASANPCPTNPSTGMSIMFGIGNPRIRLTCVSHMTRCSCVATFNEVYHSIWPSELEERRPVNASHTENRPIHSPVGWKGLAVKENNLRSKRLNSSSATNKKFVDTRTPPAQEIQTGASVDDWSPSLHVSQSTLRVPLFQFIPKQQSSKLDYLTAASDVATALVEAAAAHGAPLLFRNNKEPVSTEALQTVFLSNQLRFTTMWAFPPAYPEQGHREQNFNQGPSLAGPRKKNAYQRNSHAKLQGCSRSNSEMRESDTSQPGKWAADEEVFVEDLVGGHCFLIPSYVHASLAVRSTWQTLAKRNPDISVTATVCLRAPLHSIDIRCNRLRLALDWGMLAELTALTVEIVEAAGMACAPANPVAFDPPLDRACQRVNDPHNHHCEATVPDMWTSPSLSKSKVHVDGGFGSPWKDGTFDVICLILEGILRPWNVQLSFVLDFCEVMLPIIGPSPCPALPLLWAEFVEGYVLWTDRISDFTPRLQTDKGRPLLGTSVDQRISFHSHPNLNPYRPCLALNLQPYSAASNAATKQKGDVQGPCMETPGTNVFFDAPIVMPPPAIVVSCRLAASYYLERCPVRNTEERPSCATAADFNGPQDVRTRINKLHKTARFTGIVHDIRADMLQLSRSSRGSEGATKLGTDLGRLPRSFQLVTHALPRRGSRLTPPEFTHPELAPVTLPDVFHVICDEDQLNARKSRRRSASTGSCVMKSGGSEFSIFNTSNQARDFQAYPKLCGSNPVAQLKRWFVERHTVIDGCRCRMMATCRVVEELENPGDISEGRIKQGCPDDIVKELGIGYPCIARTKRIRSVYGAAIHPCTDRKSQATIEAMVEVEPLLVNLNGKAVVAIGSMHKALQAAFATDTAASQRRHQFDKATVNSAAHASSLLIISLNCKIECIQLESPSLCATLEDLEISFGLEPLCGTAGRPVMKLESPHYGNAASSFKTPQQSHRGTKYKMESFLNETVTKGTPHQAHARTSGGVLAATHTVCMPAHFTEASSSTGVEETSAYLEIRFMISADALHKQRAALESAVEPWSCRINIRYKPFDTLINMLLTYIRDMEGAVQWSDLQTSLLRAEAATLWKEPPRHCNSTLKRSKVPVRNLSSSHFFTWDGNRKQIRQLPSSGARGNFTKIIKRPSDRGRYLDHLTEMLGEYGTELYAELECSWLNVTAAPFLVDAILDTLSLAETAQKALQEQINLQKQLLIRIQGNSDFSCSNHSGKPADCTLATLQSSPGDPPAKLSQPQEHQTVCCNKGRGSFRVMCLTKPFSPSVEKGNDVAVFPCCALTDVVDGSCSELNTKHVILDATFEESPPFATEPARATGDYLTDQFKEAPCSEDQYLPLLVNLTGLPLAVHVEPPTQIVTDSGRPTFRSLQANHLVVDDFFVRRRRALTRRCRIAHTQAVPGAVHEKRCCHEKTVLESSTYATGRSTFDGDSSPTSGCTTPRSGAKEVEMPEDWTFLRHEEIFRVPSDDHGQAYKVAVRLQIVGVDFEICDLQLDRSQVSVKELPLDIPSPVHDTRGRHACRKVRCESLYSARILVKTVFVPSSRTFNTYLSSVISIHNNLSVPVLVCSVFPHPALALLDQSDKGILVENIRCSAYEGESPKVTAERCACHANYSNRYPTRHSQKEACDVPNVLPCPPLEVEPHGGIGHIPLSWILPKAVVAHRLQVLGMKKGGEPLRTTWKEHGRGNTGSCTSSLVSAAAPACCFTYNSVSTRTITANIATIIEAESLMKSKLFQAYQTIYALAQSLGSKPLLQKATLQQVALGRSHSVLSYECQPQIVEFLLGEGGAGADGKAATRRLPKAINHLDQDASSISSSGGSSFYAAFAVTVYGQSRDLLSEADPLFFEVGNRLFEPLGLFLVSSTSSPLPQQKESSPQTLASHSQRNAIPHALINAGQDIDILKVTSGFVFEFVTTAGGKKHQHLYRSEPLVIDYHVPAPTNAINRVITFKRTSIIDEVGNTIQQHSAEYRRLSMYQPNELCVYAEIAGWCKKNLDSTSITDFDQNGFLGSASKLTNIKTHMWGTCVRAIRIFAPYWLVNRQPEPLVVSYCDYPMQYLASCDWRLLGVPLHGHTSVALGVAPSGEFRQCCGPRKDERDSVHLGDMGASGSRDHSSLRLCSAFRIDIVGRTTAVSVPVQSPASLGANGINRTYYHFGVTVALAPPPFSRSKIVSIYTRFVLKNILPYDLWVKECSGNSPPLSLAAGSQCAFHPQTVVPGEALIYIATVDPAIVDSLSKSTENRRGVTRKPGALCLDGGRKGQSIQQSIWSSQVSISRRASFQIRLNTLIMPTRKSHARFGFRMGATTICKDVRALFQAHKNIQISIRSLDGASFVVLFSLPVKSEYLLLNNTDYLIAFAQGGLRHKRVWELLGRRKQMEYAWSDPQRERKYLRFSVLDCNQQVTKSYNIARIRVHRPLILPISKEKIYFATDVCGTSRRVIATMDAPPRQRQTTSTTDSRRRAVRDFLVSHNLWQSNGSSRAKRNGREFSRAELSFHATTKRKKIEHMEATQLAGTSHLIGLYPEGLIPQPRLLQRETKEAPRSSCWSGRFAPSREEPLRCMRADCLCTPEQAEPEKVFYLSKASDNQEGNYAARQSRMATLIGTRQKSFRKHVKSRSRRSSTATAWNSFRRNKGLSPRLPGAQSPQESNQAVKFTGKRFLLGMGMHIRISIQGFGLSLVDSTPQELVFVGCSGIRAEVLRLRASQIQEFRFSIRAFQVDNGVAEAEHQTILRQITPEECLDHYGSGKAGLFERGPLSAGSCEGVLRANAKPKQDWGAFEGCKGGERFPFLRFQFGGSLRNGVAILEYVDAELAPIALHVEADTAYVLVRFFMRLLQNRSIFFRSLRHRNVQLVREAAANRPDTAGYERLRAFPEATIPLAATLRPLYIHTLSIRPMLLILSARSQRLRKRDTGTVHNGLMTFRQFEFLGYPMTDITNFPLKSRLFVQQCVFTTAEQLVDDLCSSYVQQCIRQLHKLLASIDVIGNPLRLITGLSSSLRAVTGNQLRSPSLSDTSRSSFLKCLYRLTVNFASAVFASISSIGAGLLRLFELFRLTDIRGILSLWPEPIRIQPSRIERPETLCEGLYTGILGAVQIVGGSVVAVGSIPLRRKRASGCTGFCIGVLQGIAYLVAGPAVGLVLFCVAVAAGASSTLRRKSMIKKTRPLRVFQPHLAVLPYALHTARAMNLLEASTKRVLARAVLQPAVVAFPISPVCLSTDLKHYFVTDDRRNHSADYLLVTNDLMICLRAGSAQWVCRREDIERCVVVLPAFLESAFRAQQAMLLRQRHWRSTGRAHAESSNLLREKEQPAYDQCGIYTVHITVANKLHLEEKVLRDFSASYKAYVSHATEKRNAVQALKKNLKLPSGTAQHSVIIQLPDASTNNSPYTRLPMHSGDITLPGQEVRMFVASNVPGGRTTKAGRCEAENTLPQSDASSIITANPDIQPNCIFPFMRLLVNWFACCYRWSYGSVMRLRHKRSDLGSPTKLNRLRHLEGVSRSCEPEAITFTITFPDIYKALQVFDIICSIKKSIQIAHEDESATDVLQYSFITP